MGKIVLCRFRFANGLLPSPFHLHVFEDRKQLDMLLDELRCVDRVRERLKFTVLLIHKRAYRHNLFDGVGISHGFPQQQCQPIPGEILTLLHALDQHVKKKPIVHRILVRFFEVERDRHPLHLQNRFFTLRLEIIPLALELEHLGVVIRVHVEVTDGIEPRKNFPKSARVFLEGFLRFVECLRVNRLETAARWGFRDEVHLTNDGSQRGRHSIRILPVRRGHQPRHDHADRTNG